MEESTKNETYNRPNLDWVCTAESGCGCPNGPSPKGNCLKIAQCHPLLVDSSWKCNRPENRGGICEIGPDPNGNCCNDSTGCVPKRSLRNKRKIFVICCVSWITGILLLGIWGPNRNEFFAPGELTSNHAQIWSSGNGENRCVACHAAGDADPFSWFMDAFTGGSHIGQPQYEKCLNCHQNSIGTDHALQVHNMPKDELALLTAKVNSGNGTSLFTSAKIFANPVNHDGELACAHCHQEHHGRDHDLAAMTNVQCQSCHAKQFDSFEHGHPEFESYASTRRTPIAFDHYSHQAKHFADAKKKFDCSSCHIGDDRENVIKIKPFETSCAECHAQKIDATLTQGMPIFRIPSIDVNLLREKGLEVGQWPKVASHSFDGGIPAVMKILLASDLRAKKAMDVLGADFDLFDIDEDDEAELMAAYNLALAVKSLMYDLSQNGQTSLIERLNSISSSEISKSQLQKMVSNLSSDTFVQAQEKWFPELAAEKERLVPTLKPSNLLGSASNRTISKVVPASFVQELDGTEKDGILAENPLKEKLKSTNASEQSTNNDSNDQQSADLSFEDLPTEPTNRDPSRSTFDFDKGNVDKSRLRENKFLKQGNDSEGKSSFQPNTPNAVGNKFFQPKTTLPEINSNDRQVQELVKNPLANRSSTEINIDSKNSGPKSVRNPYTPAAKSSPQKQFPPFQPEVVKNKFVEATNEGIKTEQEAPKPKSNDPIVIRDNNLPKRIDSNETLVENPLKELLNQTKPAKDTKALLGKKENKKEPAPIKDTQSKVAKKSPAVKGPGDSEKPAKNINNATDDSKKANTDKIAKKRTVKKGPYTKDFNMNRLPPEQRVPLGGWYRDDASLTVAYRQSGHADALTVNWYEFVSHLKGAENDSAFADLAKMMTKSTSPGLCISCHSVDKGEETYSINWRTQYRDVAIREFTKFSHRPHMVQAGGDACSTCHEINPTSNVMSNYVSGNSVDNCQSGFHPIRKANCTSCHNQESRIQNCTQCHNYHVGSAIGMK